jgi:hypothetical protein
MSKQQLSSQNHQALSPDKGIFSKEMNLIFSLSILGIFAFCGLAWLIGGIATPAFPETSTVTLVSK